MTKPRDLEWPDLEAAQEIHDEWVLGPRLENIIKECVDHYNIAGTDEGLECSSTEERADAWRSALEAPNNVTTERSSAKPYEGKDKEGKAVGARYCYLDAMAVINGFEDTTLHYACMALNDFILFDSSLINLKNSFQWVMDTDDKILDELYKVRYNAIETGKYKPDSYLKPMEIDDLLDAAARHMVQHLRGNERDDESGCLHLSHFCANLLMITAQLKEF